MDVGQMASAIGSLKAAGDLAVSFINLKTMAEVQSKAIELNQKILAAQNDIFTANAAQTTFIERIRELEIHITQMEAWEAEKQRYKLAPQNTGSFVYALQKAMSNGEPAHYLCTNCFKASKPSILQCVPSKRNSNNYAFVCPICGTESLNGYSGPSNPEFVEDIPK